MNKIDVMIRFIKMIEESNMITDFIKNIFGYDDINDYNYIYRMLYDNEKIIIDIYDNITDNRFNRYVFNFLDCDNTIEDRVEEYVYVKYINVLNIGDSNNNLYKLAYLFNLDNSKMLEYANSFLDIKFVKLLDEIIK